MIKRRLSILAFGSLLLFLFVSFSANSVSAQATKKEPSREEEEKRQQELNRKTLSLLDEIVASVSGLKLPENRTFVLVASANLLWAHDEKRARNLFSEAINTLTVVKPAKTSGGERPDNSAYLQTFALRREILQAVAERDPQFAMELLHASRQMLPQGSNVELLFATERDLEQEIAAAAADRDPKKALQLGRESLAKGLSFQLLNLLFQINNKDKELGTKFAIEIIDKIKTSELNTDSMAPFLAVQLLRISRSATENVGFLMGGNSTHGRIPQRLELRQEEKRTLVDRLTNAALTVSASSALVALASEIPEAEEFFPERVALLNRKNTEAQRRAPEKVREQEQNNALVRKGQADELLKAAIKARDEERFWLEREAILAAVFSKKTETFRELIASQVDDDSQRQKMLDALDSEEIDFATHERDAEALRKLVPKIRLPEQRARAMAEIAVMLEAKGDHDAALDLLNQAESLIKVDLQSETKSNALLGLMLAYALIEPSRAFAIVERTIDRANAEVSKAILIDRFIKTGILKKGEIIMNQSGAIPIDYAVLKYGKGVNALARADFGRTKAAADRFERNELRIFARLLITQALLGAKPNAVILKAN
ncbi:MAG TPA: hypothetical protein VL866_18360 [Pyrinomonadaceae bacterium]|nr:hypothetical protein [Pyrinomonadaceae bacterium]